MQQIGSETFKLPGKNRPIYISPKEDDCSLCGLRVKTWCQHLVAAGLRMNPPITRRQSHKQTKAGTKSVSHLIKHQKQTKARTRRKKPQKNDYQDVPVEPKEIIETSGIAQLMLQDEYLMKEGFTFNIDTIMENTELT